MEITPVLPSHAIPALKAGIDSWRVGQILNALVLNSNTLRIDGALFQVATPMPFPAGQGLTVKVLQTGTEPRLAVTEHVPPPRSDEPLLALARQALPRQTSYAALLSNLIFLTRQSLQTGHTPSVPPNTLVELAKQILERLPSRDKIGNPAILKQAVQDSGLFAEQKLRRQGTAPAMAGEALRSDLKMQLLRLLAVTLPTARIATTADMPAGATSPPPTMPTPLLGAAPPPPLRGAPPTAQKHVEASLTLLQPLSQMLDELRQQTEGALARLQLHQWASLPAQENGMPFWSLELPVRNGEQVDIFQLTIEEEHEHATEQEMQKKRWSVTIAVDISPLGPLYARIRLTLERISASLWAEHPDTVALINTHLPQLGQRLAKTGLPVELSRCQPGSPPQTAPDSMPRLLLDIKA